MNSHVSVQLASYLEQHATLFALVGISLFLVDSLMLSQISSGIVGSWAFVAEKVAGVYVMR